MNALDMSVQTVRTTLLRLVPPPPPPRHPNLRELRKTVLGVVKSFEKVSEALRGFFPASYYGKDGTLLLPEERFRELASLAEELLAKINERAWAPTQRAADTYFPSLGPQLRKAVDDVRWAIRSLALEIDLMVGTGFAARAGIDTGPVKTRPESDESGEPPIPDESYAAAVALAEQRARLDDGTVDPALFALELSELLPAGPNPPRSDDPHARFRDDPQVLRVVRRDA